MPLYEYYCEPCHGIFELLRPVRQAVLAQPCPECDSDATRIVVSTFAAFTVRDGWPRRLPDDGSFLHFGKKVSSPIMGPSYQGVTHPDLEPAGGGLEAPTVEEVERWEQQLSARRAVEAEIDSTIIDADFEREKASFVERLTSVPATEPVERAKRRLVQRDLQDVRRVQTARTRRAR